MVTGSKPINGDNMKNVRCFRNKKREYMTAKINEHATYNKNKRDLYREIKEFKRRYQSRTNLVKDENGDLLTDTITFSVGGRITSLIY
jgi:hypothetical protein